MNQIQEKKLKIPVLILYALVFYSAWAVWEFWGKRAVSSAFENELLAQFIKSGLIKGLVWVLPAACLIRYFKNSVYIGLRELFTNKVQILPYLPVFLGVSAYLLIAVFLTKGKLAVSESFRYSDLVIVLFVGITEEMVFRGWLLNVTVSEKRKWLPITVNAGMFLLIHVPVWIASGSFAAQVTSLNFLAVPILSVLFSWTFLKSKSIWIPVLLHMYWDLLIYLFL